jgi:hypothetical protein
VVGVRALRKVELRLEQPPRAKTQAGCALTLRDPQPVLQRGESPLLLVEPEPDAAALLGPPGVVPVPPPLRALDQAPLPLLQVGDGLASGLYRTLQTLDPVALRLPQGVHPPPEVDPDGVELPRRQPEAGQVLRLALVQIPPAHVQVHVQVPLGPAIQFGDGLEHGVEGLIGDLRLEARLHPTPPP